MVARECTAVACNGVAMAIGKICWIQRSGVKRILSLSGFATITAIVALLLSGSAQAETTTSIKARVDGRDTGKPSLTVTACDSECNGKLSTFVVSEKALSAFQSLSNNDRVTLSVDSQSVVQTIVLTGREVDKSVRLLVLGCSLLFCVLLTTLITWWHPLQLVIGEDGRYSNSKLQMAAWFCLVIASYVAMVILRVYEVGWDFLGGINIPNNLLLLSGMSGLTFAGAKGITTAKIDAALVAGHGNPKTAGVPNFWKDLLQNDFGVFDLGDFQMFVVTLLAIGMYAVTVFHAFEIIQISQTTALPNVDTTILASFGLGQGAYLTKKAVGNAGTS